MAQAFQLKNQSLEWLQGRNSMKKAEKKMLIKHIKKDDKEFRGQIKDDMKLKKKIMSKKGKC